MIDSKTGEFYIEQKFSISSSTTFTIQLNATQNVGATLTSLTNRSVIFELNRTALLSRSYPLSPGDYSLDLTNNNQDVVNFTIVAYTS